MKHSVVLEKEFDDLPQLRCHPMQLKQVFMNLLVNAYQAIEEVLVAEGARERSEASGALRLEAGRRGVIRVVTRVRDGGITVMISDTGAGIAKEHLPRMFDPFFTTKEVGAGTGLGLSTSFGIVQRHGGQMTVESTPGEGTSFEVWLPLHPPDLEAPA